MEIETTKEDETRDDDNLSYLSHMRFLGPSEQRHRREAGHPTTALLTTASASASIAAPATTRRGGREHRQLALAIVLERNVLGVVTESGRKAEWLSFRTISGEDRRVKSSVLRCWPGTVGPLLTGAECVRRIEVGTLEPRVFRLPASRGKPPLCPFDGGGVRLRPPSPRSPPPPPPSNSFVAGVGDAPREFGLRL